MTEKDLLKKLNSYKTIQADSAWKEKNREVLLNQIINSSSPKEAGFSFGKIFNNFKVYSDIFYNGIVKNMGKPAILTSLIVLFVLGGGVMSISASRDTTPGDSLYIAKKISEKTQLALTFDEKKKAQLNVSFAKKRATEIAQVMSDEKTAEEKKEIVDKLTADFKNEINNVKTRIKKISKKDDQSVEADSVGSEEDKGDQGEESLFTANLGKGDEGLSISGGTKDVNKEVTAEDENTPEVKEAPEVEVVENDSATTTVDIIEDENSATSSEEMGSEDNSSGDILNEVKALIESEEFDATLEKLDQINDSFDQELENGEVKGVMESASVGGVENATTTKE